MQMAQPTPAHKMLERLAGSWSGTEIMHPSPWDPNGGKATGHTEARMALDGFALIADYQQERDGAITFRGHGVYTYSAAEKQYILYWFDSMGVAANIFRGNIKGDKFTLTSKEEQGYSRLSYDLSQNDRQKFLMEMSQDGKHWKPLVEATYQRDR